MKQLILGISLLILQTGCKSTQDEVKEQLDEMKSSSNSDIDDDMYKSVQEIATENGYLYEGYTVVTEDKYILSLFRIPGKVNESQQKKPAVLLQHGIDADATQWVMNEPQLAPAFILVDKGFDVWMGNNRGCIQSMTHMTLDPNKKEDREAYWDFDMEDMGLYDLPAEIEFILNKTAQKQISYIGHSMGTSQLFMALTLNYTYFHNRINVFIAEAPIVRLDHTTNKLLILLASQISFFEWILVDVLGLYDIFDPNWLESEVVAEFCDILTPVCELFLELFADMDADVDNLNRVKTYLTHVPAGSGYRNFVHYAQLINAKQFQRYDYGNGNKDIYGQSDPPLYDLNLITDKVPIALIAGSLDVLGDETDVQWLYQQLGNDSVIFYETYRLGHLSFAIAKDMSWFEVDVVTILEKYATNNELNQFLQ